jgi:drug/metabolite transporter (DMT)-like permease
MWICICLSAVIFQLFRNASSKRLSQAYGPAIASLSRFAPGIPLSLALFLIVLKSGTAVRILSPLFFAYAAAMGVCQLVANLFLIMLFKRKNFALSITLAKAETLIVALLGIPFLHEGVGAMEWAGIGIATAGFIASGIDWTGKGARALFTQASLLGLGSGAGLAFSSVFLKLAYAQVETETQLARVALCLLAIPAIQSLILIPFLARKTGDLQRALKKPALPLLTGILGLAATFCWFWAFSLTSMANVRGLGMSEFVFSLLVSSIIFKEGIRGPEWISMAAVAIGCLLVLLF